MSETEHLRGRIIPLNLGDDIEEACRKVLIGYGEADAEAAKDGYSYREQLADFGYDSYLITDSKVYKIEKEELDPYDDILNAFLNEDGSISFEVKFYNGGCGLSEAIESAIKRNKIGEENG